MCPLQDNSVPISGKGFGFWPLTFGSEVLVCVALSHSIVSELSGQQTGSGSLQNSLRSPSNANAALARPTNANAIECKTFFNVSAFRGCICALQEELPLVGGA